MATKKFSRRSIGVAAAVTAMIGIGAVTATGAPAQALGMGQKTLSSSTSVVVLRYGSTGPLVKELQRRLGITQDGSFGKQTLAAVKAFQSRKGLQPDGLVGPLTWKALGGFPGGTGGSAGTIYLTFDDGPNPTYTPQVLSVLRKHNVKATFFMLGQNAAANPSLVKRVYSEGHQVGNHSWNHPNMTGLSDSAALSQIDRTDRALGNGISCFRPPYGATNTRIRSLAAKRGEKTMLWTIDTNDWRRPGSGVIASRIVSNARNGSIVLMHDAGGNRSQTVTGVDSAIGQLKAKGFRFATLPGC